MFDLLHKCSSLFALCVCTYPGTKTTFFHVCTGSNELLHLFKKKRKKKVTVPSNLNVCSVSILKRPEKDLHPRHTQTYSACGPCDKIDMVSSGHFCPTLWTLHAYCTVTEPSALIPVGSH